MKALYGLAEYGAPTMIYDGLSTTWRDNGDVDTRPFMDVAEQQPFVVKWSDGPVAIDPQAAIERGREYWGVVAPGDQLEPGQEGGPS